MAESHQDRRAETSGAGKWVAGGVVIAGVAAALAWFGTVQIAGPARAAQSYLKSNAAKSGVVTTPSGLQYQSLREGTGPSPTASDFVLVDYEGKLVNGEVFDSTARTGQPAVFRVGEVVPGFSEGLQRMRKGGKARFVIPAALGYGDKAVGDGAIPANSVLVFEVELRDIAPPGMVPAGQ